MTDLKAQAEGKPTAQLVCRVWQHSWRIERGDVQSDGGHLLWIIPCGRCQTVKTMKISRRTGRYVKSTYQYPDDYRFTDIGKLSAADNGALRLILMERVS